MLLEILFWQEFNCRSKNAFRWAEKRDQRTFNAFRVCNFTFEIQIQFLLLVFIVVINIPPMRWWPLVYRFQLFKPFPLPLTDFQLCFRLSLRKERLGEECSGKCNRYTSLQNELFPYSISGKRVHCNWLAIQEN